MKFLARAWFCFLLATLAGSATANAATNEYYTSANTRKLIDEVVATYGGAEKMNGFERIKIQMLLSRDDKSIGVTLFQTRTKIRRDMGSPLFLSQVFDGKELVCTANGKMVPPHEGDKDELARELSEGVFQASVANDFLDKANVVVYRGKKEFEGKNYDVIETVNPKGLRKEHYINPETHLRRLEVSHKEKGPETQIFEEFKQFDGVFYSSKARLKDARGAETLGKVLDISKDFDDSVFVLPKE